MTAPMLGGGAGGTHGTDAAAPRTHLCTHKVPWLKAHQDPQHGLRKRIYGWRRGAAGPAWAFSATCAWAGHASEPQPTHCRPLRLPRAEGPLSRLCASPSAARDLGSYRGCGPVARAWTGCGSVARGRVRPEPDATAEAVKAPQRDIYAGRQRRRLHVCQQLKCPKAMLGAWPNPM